MVVCAIWGWGELSREWGREAQAAAVTVKEPTRVPTAADPPMSLPVLAPAHRTAGVFLGVSDDVLLAPVQRGEVSRVKFNRGGSSVSLRIEFDNEARAAFKPRQINLQSTPRREVAAFRFNRMMGLSSVPPSVGRAFPVASIMDNLHPESLHLRPRLEAEVTVVDGLVVGAASWWIPTLARARVDGFDIDSNDGIVTWKRYLTVGSPIPRDQRDLVAQISAMVFFDFLINNPDRWSGGNAKVSEDGRVLYFMDNTLSFGDDDDGHLKVRTHLERVQRFSRSLVDKARHVDREDIEFALGRDLGPFEFLLEDEEIAALLSRRDRALAYIDDLIATHGEAAILVFP